MRCASGIVPAALYVVLGTSTAHSDHDGSGDRGHIPPPFDRSLNLAVSAGAGIENFIAPALRDVAGTGPSWNVRVGIGDPLTVRLELTYAGSAQPLIGGAGWLMGHGAHGILRVNMFSWTTVEPFVYTGGGWTRFEVEGKAPEALGRRVDHVLEMPLGAGVALRTHGFVVEGRAGIAVVSGADLLPSMDPASSAGGETMHRFAVRVNVGIEL